MSLSSSLASAMTGLTASAKAAEIVSANIANARVEGYARRELTLTSQVIGSNSGGVAIVGIERSVTTLATADRRIAAAESSAGQTLATFYKRLEGQLGIAPSASALSSRIGALESGLIAAASAPENAGKLDMVLASAQSVITQINAAAAQVQADRMAADKAIAQDIDLLNSRLQRISDLNTLIRKSHGKSDTSALQDQRQAMIDEIASIVPLREQVKPGGELALYAKNGAILLDGSPGVFGFSASGVIVPEMTLQNGMLSGLTLNGRPIAATGEGSMLGQGRLSANFTLRDTDAPRMQTLLDATARDLIDRFASGDPTLGPGMQGLVTDNGLAFDPALEAGLAGRLKINALVDPAQGGDLWRLRSGLGVATPGPVGDPSVLDSLAFALRESRPTLSGGLPPGNRSFAALGAELVSSVATSRLTQESITSFATARAEALREIEATGQVDTDREMQILLLIERAYGANARVIQTVDRMLESLMRI